MRSIVSCVVAVLFVAGCAHPDNPDPALTITPADASGKVSITGPTDFSAVITNTTAAETVTWTVSSGGTISTTTGLHTVLTPPTGTATITLTAATADGLTASVVVTTGPQVLSGETIPGLTAPVTVTYDVHNIPHIKCATKNDCYAVQGYVQAQDRFFAMDFLRHVARGHLAEMIGVDGLSQDVTLRTLFTTRAGHRLEDDLVASLTADEAVTFNAFSTGINAYLNHLRANPGLMPGEYAQLPFPLTPTDLGEWTPQDTYAMGRLQQFQLSESIGDETRYSTFAAGYASGGLADAGKMTAWIRAAAPTTEQAHTLSPTASTFEIAAKSSPSPAQNLGPWQDVIAATNADFTKLRDFLRPMAGSIGSNNWVVAATKSKSGKAMVANDPHLSLQYPPLFHLFTMTSADPADNMDITGGSFPGIPGALVGRGKNVGWGVTVVGYDVTDLYSEQIVPGGQLGCTGPAGCVTFGAGAGTQIVPLLPVPLTFKMRTALGIVTVPSGGSIPAVTLIVPHHGPIIKANPSTGAAISVRWNGQEGNTHDLSAFLGLNTAKDVDSAMVALKLYATGAQNFVLADDQGHIAYDPHSLVPNRLFASLTAPSPHAPWFVLPSDGTAEWGDGTANCSSATLTPLPAGCWLTDAQLPQGKDPTKGYYFTSNADPTSPSVSDDNNPLGHPPYMSFGWDDSTGFRAKEVELRLEAAIAAGGVTLDNMESIQADHISRPGKAFHTFIKAIPTTSDTANVTAARAVFADWETNGYDCPSGLTGSDPVRSPVDPTASVVASSAGCFLFHDFIRVLFRNVFTDDLKIVGLGVDQLQAMKAMLYMLANPGAANTKFCNDVSASGATVATKTCEAQVLTAMATAYASITAAKGTTTNWKWGAVHTMQPRSLLALVTTNYEPGPYARPGGAFTVDVGTPSTEDTGLAFPFGSSGNVRHISVMDAAAPVVKMQLPGPERDGPAIFDGGPSDLLAMWVLNKYFDFATGSQSAAAAVSSQTFTAH